MGSRLASDPQSPLRGGKLTDVQGKEIKSSLNFTVGGEEVNWYMMMLDATVAVGVEATIHFAVDALKAIFKRRVAGKENVPPFVEVILPDGTILKINREDLDK